MPIEKCDAGQGLGNASQLDVRWGGVATQAVSVAGVVATITVDECLKASPRNEVHELRKTNPPSCIACHDPRER